MTLRDDLISVVDDARGIVDDLGLRQQVVQVVTRTRVAGMAGLGVAPTTSTLTIDPPPKVGKAYQWSSTEGGLTKAGDIPITKISASYTRAQLDPDDSAETAASVWLIDGVEHELVTLHNRSFEWRAVVRAKRR